MGVIKIWTDGSANNHTHDKGGYGIVMLNGSLNTFCGGSYINTTSIRMEILAVVRALQKCNVGDDVIVISDNQHVVEAISKNYLWNWQKSDFRGKANADLWRQFIKQYNRLNGKVEMEWTRGHDDNEMNELADKLAKMGGAKSMLITDK